MVLRWMRGDGVQDAVLVRPGFKIRICSGDLLHCVVAIVLEEVGAVVIAVLCATVQRVEESQVLSGELERCICIGHVSIVVGLALGHGDGHVSIVAGLAPGHGGWHLPISSIAGLSYHGSHGDGETMRR